MPDIDPQTHELAVLIQNHIDHRLANLEKAFQQKLDDMENRMNAKVRAESAARELAIKETLVRHIQTDVSSGMKSKEVAHKHSVPANFVSKVAPRAKFAPGNSVMQ